MEINKILVIGAGQMGAGIAQVCAQSGFQVALHDMNEEALTKGINGIEKLLHKDIQKERITEEDKEEVLNRISTSTNLQEVGPVDIVIEAIVENMDIKTKVFAELDQIMPEQTILASNTSSLPITEIAAATNRPEKVIGMHFMNPVPVMKLVEIIRGLETNEETYQSVESLAKALHKTPVEVNDSPGFVSNRILLPMINEAIYALYEGVSTKEDIDTVMKLGMNHPMGPLQLADFIGLDTCLYIMEVLYEGFGDSKYRPCPLLRKYVKAGRLGKKVGKGFYDYESSKAKVNV